MSAIATMPRHHARLATTAPSWPPRPAPHRAQRGIAAIEAALILPLLAFIILAGVETYAYLRAAALTSRTGFAVASLLARTPALAEPEDCAAADSLCTLGAVAPALANPLPFTQRGAMGLWVFESFSDDPTTQPGEPATWALPAIHTYSMPTTASLPITFPDLTTAPEARLGDVLIVVRTAYEYTPVLLAPAAWAAIVGSPRIDRVAYARGQPGLIPPEP